MSVSVSYSSEEKSSPNVAIGDLESSGRHSREGGNPQSLITDHIDIWTSAIKSKSSAGRGTSNKLELVGIKKLRELILELAVRGKLVPQNPNDEPASELLKRIEAEKVRLVKEGKIKKQKIEYELAESDISFDIPNNWKWVKLGNVINFINGYAFKSSDFSEQGIGIVKIGDIQNGVLTPETMSRVNPSVVANIDIGLRVIKGDLLIAMSGATTGKLGFNTSDEYFYLNQRVGKICPYLIDPCYLYFPLTTKIAENLGKSLGSAIPNLSTAQINEIAIALPPINEQQRIVAKVDELMALCDQLETQTESGIQAHQVLVETLLATLSNAKNADELFESWQTISQHFDVLFTTQDSIDQLKQTILQLAVMGKLVKQDPKDEPAANLLERIATEKQQLIKDGKIKKQKPLPPITDEEKLFELPHGWEFSRFGNIWVDSFYGPRFGKNEYVNHGGYPTIRTTDMTPSGRILLKEPPEVLVAKSKLELYGLSKGDLLITRSGSIGTMAIFDLDLIAIPSAYLIRVRLPKQMSSEFTLLMLMSPLGQEYLGLNTTSVGVPNVNASKMSEFLLAIPPLTEQRCIVAKVDELMALCDSLKAKLNQAQTTQLYLTEAIVEQAL